MTGGNTDVYVVPAAGGDPNGSHIIRVRIAYADGRLTGNASFFASDRTSPPQVSYLRLWSVPVDGGFEEPLPMPRAFSGHYSPDGKRIAYEEISNRVHAGLVRDEHVASLSRRPHTSRFASGSRDYSVEKLPWKNSNDRTRCGSATPSTSCPIATSRRISLVLRRHKQLKQLTHHDDFDIMTASAGPDAIVYEQAGYIHLVDAKSGQSHQLKIDVVGDFPWARPQFKRVGNMIRDASLSPTGVRAAFEARGDIFTVPTEKGDFRNLTRQPGGSRSDPAWSPDGSQLAWLSDASGEYQLMIGDQSGLTKPRAVALPTSSYYSNVEWSPNGKLISLEDNHLNLWTVDVATGRATKVDTDTYRDAGPRVRRRHGRRTQAGSRTRRVSTATSARSSCIRWPTRSRIRSPTVSPTRSRPRSTRAASISISSPAPITARARAGLR